MTAKHPMIPFPVIVRAADGDIEAVNQIVRHYSGFIASRSMPVSYTHLDVYKRQVRKIDSRNVLYW